MAKFLTKAAIEAADDLPSIEVPVPEWGGVARLRGLTGAERDAFEIELVKPEPQNVRAKLVARCLVGDDGARLYGDQEIEALGAKSGKALDRLFAKAQTLNGLTEADLEELEKN